MPQYANSQPAGFKNRIENIAIVGVGGHIGQYIVKHLLASGAHKVTALMRASSTSSVPAGVEAKVIDYSDHASMVAALQGQDALVITQGTLAPKEQQPALIRAAAEAGVAWVMPNHYGNDITDAGISDGTMLGPPIHANIKLIEELGLSWVSLACNFWYEWSLTAGTTTFGISWPQRKAVLYDEGQQKICSTTWDQAGRAVAALFGLKVLPDDENDLAASLTEWRNRFVYVRSFTVSQRDMLAALQRATGTTDADFDISTNPLPDYYQKARDDLKAGDRSGFPRAMYSRVFFKDGAGDFTHKTVNARLGIPVEEDLDEATRRCVQWLDEGKVTWHHD